MGLKAVLVSPRDKAGFVGACDGHTKETAARELRSASRYFGQRRIPAKVAGEPMTEDRRRVHEHPQRQKTRLPCRHELQECWIRTASRRNHADG